MSVTTVAAVLGGGSGSRFAGDRPKQFTLLGDRPVFAHAVQTLLETPGIDAVYLVVPAAYAAEAKAWKQRYGWEKVTRILPGSSDRAGSTLAALTAAEEDGATNILLHDAARPLLEQQTVEAIIKALADVPAAVAAIQATDTVAVAGANSTIAAVPRRDTLWQLQTPQGFHVSVLRDAYRLAESRPEIVATDDSGLVHACLPNVPIRLVPGSRRAAKLTYPEDLAFLSNLLNK